MAPDTRPPGPGTTRTVPDSQRALDLPVADTREPHDVPASGADTPADLPEERTGWRSRVGREDLPMLFGLPVLCAAIIIGWLIWRANANLDDIESRALAWSALGSLVREHLVLTVVAALAVVCTAIPTGILLTRPGIERAAPLVVGLANAGQAAPVIGIIVLLAMWLSFGFWTAVLALTIYAFLPVLRNTIVGLQGVDRTLIEAARGMGMSQFEALRRVEMPLAMPVIMSGVRTALVLVVGTAAFGTFVNAGGLGTLIVTGITLFRTPVLISGGLLIAVLALLIDWLGRVMELLGTPKGMTPMRPGSRLRGRVGALVLVAPLLLSACGLGTAGGFTRSGTLAGPLADIPSLNGATIAVGSKNFSEQLLVGKIAVILIASAGANVADYTNIPGSSSTRQALLQDELGMVWEYTGTAWIAYLGNTDPIPDEVRQWEAVRDADAKLGLEWLDPAPMNNTYGFAMTQAKAKELGITKLSQIKDIPVAQRTFCVEAEFNNRNDGFGPMLETYDLARGANGVPDGNVKLYDTGAIYAATSQGDCTFGEVFTTDGRIKALDLVVLEDDRQFFPAYNLSPVFQKHVLDEHPQLRELFAPVAQEMTNEVLLDLNARIDVDGQEPSDVAWEWLVAEGFVRPA